MSSAELAVNSETLADLAPINRTYIDAEQIAVDSSNLIGPHNQDHGTRMFRGTIRYVECVPASGYSASADGF
jgi:hypothetical protein